MRRQLTSRLRVFAVASVLAITSLALTVSSALADGNGWPIPH